MLVRRHNAESMEYPQGYAYALREMPSIRRQLATFFAVLAVLYAGGFIAGQFIETGEDAPAAATVGRAQMRALSSRTPSQPTYPGLGSPALSPVREGRSAPGHTDEE